MSPRLWQIISTLALAVAVIAFLVSGLEFTSLVWIAFLVSGVAFGIEQLLVVAQRRRPPEA